MGRELATAYLHNPLPGINLPLLQELEVQRFVRARKDLLVTWRRPQQALSVWSVDLVSTSIGRITTERTFAPRLRAILPRHIVVFVRIPGCSSFAVFARHLNNSPLIIRSDSFVIIVKTALTVCSRTTGAKSVKPVT